MGVRPGFRVYEGLGRWAGFAHRLPECALPEYGGVLAKAHRHADDSGEFVHTELPLLFGAEWKAGAR